MTVRPHEFIDAVYVAVYRTAIDGVLRLLAQPPGRRPRPDLAELSTWFNDLNETDRHRVEGAVRLAVDQAVFGMLAGLDGSRSLGKAADLSLRSDGVDLTAEHDLHDLFRSVVDQALGYD
jgi:hypothetical protein